MADLTSWLSDLGLNKYAEAFIDAEIDFATLPDLTEEDLKELGLPIGPRRKMWSAISRMGHGRGDATPTRPEMPVSAPEVPTSSDVSADAERRHLTVMFVDLVDSTGMASGVDPEDMRDVITGYQNTVAGVIARHEGFVAKFMGDGVLCYFGWPNASEDDTERAVRAELGIIASVNKLPGPKGAPLATRIPRPVNKEPGFGSCVPQLISPGCGKLPGAGKRPSIFCNRSMMQSAMATVRTKKRRQKNCWVNWQEGRDVLQPDARQSGRRLKDRRKHDTTPIQTQSH